MLINTVILFLRDLLPIFIILSFYLNHTETHIPINPILSRQYKNLVITLLVGCLCAILIANTAPVISQWNEGAGIEWLYSSGYGFTYLSLLYYCCVPSMPIKQQWALRFMLFILMAISGANFIIYFQGFWSEFGAIQAIVIGMILGIGICLSVAILLYFFLRYCELNQYRPSIHALFIIFIVGQVSQIINLLNQVNSLPDVFQNQQPLWQSQAFIAENSEWGHLLSSFIGYEDSPNLPYLSAYLCAYAFILLIPILIKRIASISTFLITQQKDRRHV
ncbi:hypothetical protein [Algibacillus agarilyticus]|uniref:hypothetical protein n=1 Tax=Algibacillus agarilyticus TaxID=2234133 RepID=UPI000DCF6935|nr:hypothetical protein [Algibacillus agarilyticus]